VTPFFARLPRRRRHRIVTRMTDAGFPDLTPEEFAHVTTGPNLFALGWVGEVLSHHVEPAWAAISAEFRLALAQMWIYHNPGVLDDPRAGGLDRDGLAERLLDAQSGDELFVNMRAVEIRTIKQSFGEVRFDDLGTGVRPRPIGPSLELVRLLDRTDLATDENGYHYLLPGGSARAVRVIVTSIGEGWEVAGVGQHLLRPGWPPTHEQIVGPAD
jgi:hypothetical protein